MKGEIVLKKLMSWLLIFVFIISNFTLTCGAKSISDLNKERAQIQDKSKQAKQGLEQTKTEKSKVLTEVEKLDKELTQVQEELDRLTEELEKTKINLNQSEQDLSGAIEDKEQQYSTLKKRIRVMYESGSIGYLQIVLEAESFSDFFKRIEYINRLMEYDEELLEKFKKTEQLIATKVEEIKNQKINIEVLSNQQKSRRHALNENIQVKENLVKQLSSDEVTYLQQIKDLEDADKDVTSLIVKAQQEQKRKAELEAQRRIAAQKAAAQKAAAQKSGASKKTSNTTSSSSSNTASSNSSNTANVSSYSGGRLQYPVPAYSGTRPNSPYGWRTGPIDGKREFHTGVDLKATMGTNVVAAESGVVIFSGTRGGYGKCVIIDHGGSLSTLYAHNSKLLVSVGDTVSRGQVIAKAGTTGYSTGVHLHFEVRVNGQHTNPMDYL